MQLNSSVVAIALFGVLCLAAVNAEPQQQQQRRRFQQQQQQEEQSSYPAAGFQPARQFALPSENLEPLAEQPAITYGAPEPARLTAARPKPARLTANSEAREDIDDAAEEVAVAKAAPAMPAAAPAPLQPAIAYYPAGAVSFVQPAAFAKLSAPVYGAAPLLSPAHYTQQPAYYTAYSAPLLG